MKMLKILAITVLAGSATVAMADEKVITEDGVTTYSTFKPAQVRAEVGTTGYGGAVSWSVNPYTAITLGYNGGDISWSPDVKSHGTSYDSDVKNSKNAYLNAEIRPFANWLYVAAGVGYIDTTYHLARNTTAGVESYDYSYNNVFAPYAGIGVSPAITDRIGLFGEVGAYYAGNPTAVSTGTVVDAQHLADLNNTGRYEWLPVAKVGVSYRF